MHRIRRLRPFFLVFLAVWYAYGMTAVAQTTTPPAGSVDVYATHIKSMGAAASGVKATATLEAVYTGTSAGVRNYSVPLTVGSGTLGSLARAAVRRGLPIIGWGLVFRDIINGAGWAIDELRGEIVTRPDDDPIPPGDMYWMDSLVGKPWSSDTAAGNFMAAQYTASQAVRGYVYTYEGLNDCTAPDAWGAFSCKARIKADYGNGTSGYIYPGIAYVRNVSSNTLTPEDLLPQVVPMVQVGEAVKSYPDVADGLMRDRYTGAPHMTPELADAINALRRSIEAANNFPPRPDVQPDPTSGQGGTPGQSAWPSFCSWASAVCEWLEWTKEPPGQSEQPQDPWAEDQTPDAQQWNSGIGGGGCPAPAGFTVSLAGAVASPSFSFEPLCQFLASVRPVIIAIATLYAAYIIAGMRAQKNV